MYRVLLVEDDPMVLSINKRFLERVKDIEVVATARNGQEALDKIRELRPDLVILDIFMPETHGLEVLRQIRQAGFDVDVIMVTAAQDPQSVTESLRLGVIDYIIKPYEFSRLKQALDLFRQRKILLASKDTLTQQHVDLIKSPAETSRSSELPKGLERITMEKIKSIIANSSSPLSVEEIAAAIKLSHITVRRYLDYLVETGEITFDLKYGPVGRPTRVYMRI